MADYFSDMREAPRAAPPARQTASDGALIEADGDDALVSLEPGEIEIDVEIEDPNFDRNLAERVGKAQRKRIAERLIDAIAADRESRADWQRRLDDGLELMGLKDRPRDKEPFPGASEAVHPLISEAMVQFQARALPELVPSAGPVKATVIGERSDEREDQAERVGQYLNWRLLDDDVEWFDDTDQMLLYLPFGGMAFRKLFVDTISGKAKARYVKAEDFIVPYKAKSLADAPRYTHAFDMARNDIERAIEAGAYADIDLHADRHADAQDNNPVADAADLREPGNAGEDDETHRLYEVHCGLDLDADRYRQAFELPYIVTIDTELADVLSIRRNWDEQDDTFSKLIWFAPYKFLPGLGFYGFGFLHLIGGLSKAATGALRALLDAAARSNLQGGFKSKDARGGKVGDVTIEPGKYKDIDLTAEELAKAFYTPNWPQPSPALFNLLGVLTEAGQRFASTTDVNVGDANPNAPVGTTVALVEQGQKVFSAIHRRLHRAAAREYRLFAKLDAKSLGDAPYPFAFAGVSRQVRAADFSEAIDVLPVSDPNVFSHTQRIAMAQAVVQLVGANPDIYGKREKLAAHKRLLHALRVPDPDDILPDDQGMRRDPVTENQYLLVGEGVEAYPDQDHAAHIKIHEAVAAQYAHATGQAADMMQAAMQAHLAQHHAYAYRAMIIRDTGLQLPSVSFFLNHFTTNR